MLDDTGYFLACCSPEQAALVAAILNDPAVTNFLGSLSFPGAKRPLTKAVLQRIDLAAVITRAGRLSLLGRAQTGLAGLNAAGPVDWPKAIESVLTS